MPLVSRMTYRHAFILESAMLTLITEARRYRFKESGGPLAGYVSADGAVVVTHASGPGKKGARRLFGVTISGEHAQAFCDDVWRMSGGLFDYVGDWHTHIGYSVGYSGPDVAAMCKMAAFDPVRMSNPISLILSRITRRFAVYALKDDGTFEIVPNSILKDIPGIRLCPGIGQDQRSRSTS